MSIDSLINSHRPRKFSEVIGQKAVVGSFKNALDDATSHAFLFTGPSGVGKTTLARLGAEYLGCGRGNIIEVDAATYSGVDDMRSLTETLGYRPLGKGSKKAIIIDEAHAISANAWKALLKSVEEPPAWVFWFFCTTDANKVPKVLNTRCATYNLRQVSVTELYEFLLDVVDIEKFKTETSIVDLCAKKAEGSPRAALSNLAVCYGAKDRSEAARLLEEAEVETVGTGFELAKALAEGRKWDKIQPLLRSIADSSQTAEGVRHTVRSYFTTVALGAKDEKTAIAAFRVLDQFAETFNPADGFSPLVVAVGRTMFAG